MEHTPGPWDVINNVYGHSRLAIMQPSGVLLAEIVDWPDESMTEANARLIAAAPDLLVACERIMQEAARDCIDESEWSEGERMAHAAIMKARGI